jgi:hypothetical protein
MFLKINDVNYGTTYLELSTVEAFFTKDYEDYEGKTNYNLRFHTLNFEYDHILPRELTDEEMNIVAEHLTKLISMSKIQPEGLIKDMDELLKQILPENEEEEGE